MFIVYLGRWLAFVSSSESIKEDVAFILLIYVGWVTLIDVNTG